MILPAPGPTSTRASLPTFQVWDVQPPLDGVGAPFIEPVSQGGAVAGGVEPLVTVSVPQGGAVASGNTPTVVLPVPQGGATAGGSAPVARIATPQGGAVAAGSAPVPLAAVLQGGATVAGPAPSPAPVPLAPGGVIAAGFPPTDSSGVTEPVPPGGALAGGFPPTEIIAPPPPPPTPPVTGTFSFGRSLITEFPAGMEVGIYSGDPNGPPHAPPIDTATVSEALTVTLPLGFYYLGAQVDVIYRPLRGDPYPKPEWRFVSFKVP